MNQHIDWPTPPPDPGDNFGREIAKKLYQAQLDAAKEARKAALDSEVARAAALVELQKADYANEYATFQEVYKGYIEVAKGQIERSLQRAEFVQKVAAAIGTAYAAILALSFSVKESPLPAAGVAPTFFLGMAFFLAAAYVAFLTKPERVEGPPSVGTLRGDQYRRRNTFILWTRNAVLRRRYLLQASVVSLGFGILFLPAPYLDVAGHGTVVWILLVLALALTFLLPALLFEPRDG